MNPTSRQHDEALADRQNLVSGSLEPESTDASANSMVSPQVSTPFEAGWCFT